MAFGLVVTFVKAVVEEVCVPTGQRT